MAAIEKPSDKSANALRSFPPHVNSPGEQLPKGFAMFFLRQINPQQVLKPSPNGWIEELLMVGRGNQK